MYVKVTPDDVICIKASKYNELQENYKKAGEVITNLLNYINFPPSEESEETVRNIINSKLDYLRFSFPQGVGEILEGEKEC